MIKYAALYRVNYNKTYIFIAKRVVLGTITALLINNLHA